MTTDDVPSIEVSAVISSARFQTEVLCPSCSAPMVELHVGGIHGDGVVELPDLMVCLDCTNPVEVVAEWRANLGSTDPEETP